jgi:branched-chain amino acid transport system ATP-binding protein
VMREVFTLAQDIIRLGIAVLMVEQNARQSLKVAHFAYLLEHGHVVEAGLATDIAGKKRVQDVFLGGSA